MSVLKSFVLLLSLVLASVLFAPVAFAQPTPIVGNCVYTTKGGRYICQPSGDVRTQTLVQSSLLTSGNIRDVLSMRFFPVGTGEETAGVLNYAAEESDGTNGAFDGFSAAETAEVPLFSIWGNLAGAYSNRSSATAGFEGALVSGSVGADRQLGTGTVFGAFGSAETSSYDTVDAFGTGTVGSHGFGIGAYAGQMLGDSVFANTTVQYRQLSNSFTVAATGADYTTRVLDITAGLTGYYQYDMFRLSPSATVGYSHEWQDAYVETSGAASPARQTDVGVASVGLEGGYTFFTADGRTIEPWASVGLDWTFWDATNPAGPVSPDPINAIDARVGTGVNLALSDTSSLALRGDVSGLTTPDYIVLSAGGQFSVRY